MKEVLDLLLVERTVHKMLLEVVLTKDDDNPRTQFEDLFREVQTMKEAHQEGSMEITDLSKTLGMPSAKPFKIPDFTKYSGIGDPYAHLIAYVTKLGKYESDENSKMALFQTSLSAHALTWYAHLDDSKIKTWADLSSAFLEQYSLQHLLKDPNCKEMVKMGNPSFANVVKHVEIKKKTSSSATSSGAQNNPPKFSQEEKRVRYERNRARVFTPLDEPLDKVLAILLNQKKITSLPPMPSREIKNFDPTQKCAYHSGGVGHSTEKCWSLKHKIQDLIDSRDIVVSTLGKPNVTTNPLPKHHDSQVNLLELEVMMADQGKSIPTTVQGRICPGKVGSYVPSMLTRE